MAPHYLSLIKTRYLHSIKTRVVTAELALFCHSPHRDAVRMSCEQASYTNAVYGILAISMGWPGMSMSTFYQTSHGAGGACEKKLSFFGHRKDLKKKSKFVFIA